MPTRRRVVFLAAITAVGLVAAFVVWCIRGGPEKPLIPESAAPRPSWREVRNSLIASRWKQDGPYAALTPRRQLLGCWSVAFAQVLAYHRLAPAGRVMYRTAQGVTIDVSFQPTDWDLITAAIGPDTSTERSAATAEYCYAAAIVVQKDFGRGDYKDVSRVPYEIAEHYGCTVDRIPSRLEETVRSELSAGRPLVAYFDDILGVNHSIGIKIVRIGHAAVLDGMAEENGRLIVHVNMALGDSEDGWYDFKTLAHERELLYVFRIVPKRRLIPRIPERDALAYPAPARALTSSSARLYGLRPCLREFPIGGKGGRHIPMPHDVLYIRLYLFYYVEQKVAAWEKANTSANLSRSSSWPCFAWARMPMA